MKIVIPVEIELDTYGAVDEVLSSIGNCFDYDIDGYNVDITNKDVIRKNFTIDVLQEALKQVKGE